MKLSSKRMVVVFAKDKKETFSADEIKRLTGSDLLKTKRQSCPVLAPDNIAIVTPPNGGKDKRVK